MTRQRLSAEQRREVYAHIGRLNHQRGVMRFWARVEKTSTCWLWRGRTDHAGYGKAFVRTMAHRYAYEQLVGAIPAGLELDHLCRVRHCVNPAHLEPVTHLENVRRGKSFAAVNALVTACPRGHAYDTANTYRSPSGARYCRSCTRLQHAKYRRVRAARVAFAEQERQARLIGAAAGTRAAIDAINRPWTPTS